MKLLYPAGSKREWFDRNPVVANYLYNAQNVAPHASTERWRYTCPVGKRAYVSLASISMMRQTAPGAVNLAQAFIRINDGAVDGDYGSCMVLSNTVGAEQHQTFGQFGWLTTAQYVAGYTVDASTGGTFAYYISVQIIQFDA